MKAKRIFGTLLIIGAINFVVGCGVESVVSSKDDDNDSVEDKYDETQEYDNELTKEQVVMLTPQEAMDGALKSLTGEGEDFSIPAFLGADGKQTSIAIPTGSAFSISEDISYEIVSLNVSEQEGKAVASVEIETVDAKDALLMAIEGMTEFDRELFLSRFEENLKDANTKTFVVDVDLVKAGETWCVVLNDELVNAITGGLSYEYERVRQSIIESMTKLEDFIDEELQEDNAEEVLAQ